MTSSGERPPARGSLKPGEMAHAAVMAALTSALAIIAVAVPFAAGLSLLGLIPMGILAYRYRLRVLVAAGVAGALIAFLIAGMGGMMTVLNCAYIGGLTGVVKRKGRGTPTVIVVSLIAGAVFGAFAVAALTVLTRIRTLIFDTMAANAEGTANAFEWLHLGFVAWLIRVVFAFLLANWQLLILVYAIFAITTVSLLGWWVLSRVLNRLQGIPDVHKLEPSDDTGAVAPLPATLRDVTFRYPGADHDALDPLTVHLQLGEHVAVTGANGSGKTTLMLLLAGREPTSGVIERPGAIGMGKTGGTAVVMQHPESQVLGTRVADDVVWGLPHGTPVDVAGLLEEVGLGGFEERESSGLSGGELQRLAVAGALAREPSLLIADEVTSMVDQQGRDALLEVLSGLTQRRRTSLVHITHYTAEAEMADRTVALSASQDNTATVEQVEAPEVTTPAPAGAPLWELSGVGYEYAGGTPWAKTALRDVTFTINEGDGVLIHGGNGSGKSTLAWIMAGLTTPTTGTCLLGGKPADEQVGAIAISFQAARLQLMRSRVGSEVAASGGFSKDDHARVASALAAVGVDAALATRRIDQLSGGQMRRVVLAGLLARSPKALILDEPLAGLDAASQRRLLRLLEDLRRTTGLTVVVISHDFLGLDGLCNRILQLQDGALEAAPTPTGGGMT